MDFLIITIVAILTTTCSIPPTIYLAKKFGLVDDPKKRPHPAHIHQITIPRAGGIPIFIGIAFGIGLFVPLDKHIIGILLACLLLLVNGILDDIWINYSPYPRLIIQILAALIVVASGVGISFITNPLGGILNLDQIIIPFNFLGSHKIVVIADILAIIWIVWMMNMINWSKGIDGQMPGMATVTGIILGLLSLKFYFNGDTNQLHIAILSFILAGTTLAFMVFNWYPAKIFPGFSGSNIIGFMIAVLSILSGGKLATAGLVLLVPATDFIYTFLRRILQKKSPFFADRKHLYHKLLDKGLKPPQIALFYILGSAILGALALSLNSQGKLFAVVLVSIIILGTILWLNFFGHLSKPPDQDNG